jgi:hypothetical protein
MTFWRKKDKKLIYFSSIIVTCFYFCFIIVLHKYLAYHSYDLMKDALSKQNLTRFKVKCSEIDDIKNDAYINEYTGDMDSKYVTDRLKLFKNYYLKISFNYYTNYSAFELQFDESENGKLNNLDIRRLIKNLKICAINWNKQIVSKRFDDSYLDYLYRYDINYDIFKKDDVNILNLNLGGYHKPQNCLQEFFFYLSIYKTNKFDDANQSEINASDVLSKKPKISKSYKQYEESDGAQIEIINKLGEKGLRLFKKSMIKLKKSKNINNIIKEISKSSIGILNSLFSSTNINSYKNDIINDFNNEKQKFTAIIIPFLNRDKNLIELLLNLHPFLQRQYVHYRIFVAEQHNSNDPFNKGRLYNMAFKYIKNKYQEKVSCFILHDVDLIPESDYNLYECDNYLNVPRHLSFSIRTDKSNASLTSYLNSPYELLVGGVLCIKPFVYEKINGFSNEYWSWGAEDDGNYYFYSKIKSFI